MQPRHARRAQLIAQVGDHVEPESLDRFGVVAEALQPQPHPARNLGPATVGETDDAAGIRDRHDAGHHRNLGPQRVRLVDETEVRVGVEKHLRDGRTGPGLHLREVGLQVGLRRTGLRVHLGVGTHLDVKVVAGLGADEGHQITGVAELTHARAQAVAAGQITAQRHDAAQACGLELTQFLADRFAAGTDAGEMRCAFKALGHDGLHRAQRAVLRAAAGPVSDRAEQRLQRIQLLARSGQLGDALGRLGRKEFEAQRQTRGGVLGHGLV